MSQSEKTYSHFSLRAIQYYGQVISGTMIPVLWEEATNFLKILFAVFQK